ncbi:amidase signature domain-containing protein [Xylaria bambusicola]|uniref:amidase signature domain-containing protein n=1 Tax=Xylaria bambusicola TaxID=326684 RepID=UPI002008283C|nr:amidase signature domain-containing protein [Xylaria bambusicola]KAI0513013.1 amidase signature domain-containing protein [Xylaria bambusicola]
MDSSQSCLQMPLCRGVSIEELSITQLQCHLAKGSFTSRDLTQCYLRRIELVNPRIKAVIETNPDALKIADELDAERERGMVRSKIHGIPFLVKDNIATRDSMQTTAGCAALLGTIVPNDATVVALLRAAGGVLLGKANLSEWASMRASYYSEAYSSRGGQNRNPYNLAEHPGGSSSGSASALAANMCAFSIGTETDGSVIFPADRNAVVGIKPTVGLTSTLGVIPEAPSFDTVGTFGRSVEDATIALDIIADRSSIPDSHADAYEFSVAQIDTTREYTSWLATKDVLKGARFGLPSKRIWEKARSSESHKAEYLALIELIKQIEEAGAEVFDVDFPSAEEIISPDGWNWEYAAGVSGSQLSEFEVVKVEFYRSLSSYLSTLENNKAKILTLEDVVAYNIKHTGKEGGVPGTHPAWPTGQDNFDRCIASKDDGEAVYLEALEYNLRKSRDEGIDAAMMHGKELDGLLVPVQAEGGAACSVAAKAGYPMITVPVGVNDNGVPFGIGIIQQAWQEAKLVKYGSAIEDLIRHRPQPKFLNLDADNYTYVGNPPDATTY